MRNLRVKLYNGWIAPHSTRHHLAWSRTCVGYRVTVSRLILHKDVRAHLDSNNGHASALPTQYARRGLPRLLLVMEELPSSQRLCSDASGSLDRGFRYHHQKRCIHCAAAAERGVAGLRLELAEA